jgi:hypothetical protein
MYATENILLIFDAVGFRSPIVKLKKLTQCFRLPFILNSLESELPLLKHTVYAFYT